MQGVISPTANLAPSPDGFGQAVTVDDLINVHKKRIEGVLATKQEDVARVAAAVRSKRKAEKAIESFTHSVRSWCGSGCEQAAFEIVETEIAKQEAAEKAVAKAQSQPQQPSKK